MPICKREGFEDFTKNPKQQTFHDNEEVFYCETTKQIFRDYEEYFRHVMVINSTIWQCEETGRENLTYAEALKSERRARMKMDQFKDCLRPIVMLLIEKIQQSSMKALCHLSYSFIRSRFFVEEDVEAVNKSTTYLKYVVVGVVPLSSAKTPPDGNVYDPTKVTYKLRKVGGQFHGKEYLIPRGSIRRGRNECCHDNLRLFIKNNVTRVEGILRPNPESYKKYVTDRKITFAKVFLGKLPHYEPSKPIKPKKLDSEKKQASMAKYLTKDGVEKARKGETPEEEAARQQRSKALLEEMERVRKEKEAKQAELERKKMERLAKIETEAAALAKKTDDLERFDQQPLPKFKSISTQIPNKYFGDCIMIQEFMHSFVGILSGIHVFRNNISFFELTRAFTTREVAGPLSDIIMILLGTIFDLQQEEESECNVEYQRLKNKEREPYATIALATKTHEFTKRFYGYKINELPLDAQTVSEILRLHLLGSGANVSGKTERWRIMYRNGYYSSEDPGLALRMSQPHILRALKMYTVYQLPIVEIFHIIKTLIAQILTYSSTINMIEERMEQTAKSKMELRTLVAAENRRMCNVESERKKLILEHAIQIKELPEENKVMEEKLNKKVADLLAISARERKKFDAQIEKVRSSLFDYMVFLGMDRAYRKYYVLESMPGIFVEHSSECHDVCLENPPKNVPHLVGCPRTLREIRMHLSRLYVEEEDPSRKKRKAQPAQPQAQANQENKENKENQAVMNGGVKLNGDANKMEADGAVEPETIVPEVPPPPPTQYQLMMCTGDPNNCIVHDHKNPDRQRWAFFHTEEDLDALIKSLNSLGDRESALKEQLKTMRELIASHIKKCPVEMLSIEDENTSRFSRFKAQMRDETRRKYNAANFGFPDNTDLSEVMYAMLVDRILQMEIDTTTGDLGKLKIKDLEKWRSDVQNNTYDSQAELKWGIGNEAKPHKDPGLSLGDTIDIDSEDSSDEGISLHDSPILRQCVKNLSSALLQIEQGIEQRFLKEPFGVNKEIKDKEKMDGFLERGRYRLRHWETSLMKSTSYSQVFLHLNILHGAIKWQRSTNKSSCQICRRMTDPEKMLLCDECNAGTHMFCMKPKMKTVPEGNWYCKRCVTKLGITDANKEPIKNKRKRAFLLDEEDNGSEGSSRSINRRQRKHLRIEEIEEQIEEEEEQQSEEDVDESLEGEDSDGDDKDPEYEATEEDKREAAADCSGEDVEAEDEGEQAVDDDDDDDDDDEDDDDDDDEEEEVEEEEEEVEDKVETPRDPLANSKDEEEVEDEQEEQDSSIDEDEEACVVCSYNGGEIACAGCKSVYHLDCVDLKRPPRSNWNCRTCKGAQSKKRKSKQNEDSTDDEEYDQPLVKRPRNSTGNKRSSARSAMYEGHSSEEFIRTNNNNSRRARRAGDHLPLNSSILYDLLDDIMKNDSSWPFLRPVSASEVPDYHKIIKEPMDFAKVKSKLNMGKYTINEELLKDIELIFKNCDIYNQEGNEIYEAGSSLEKFVMARCKELQLPFQPSDMNRS